MNPLIAAIKRLMPQIVQQTTWSQAADEDRFEGYLFGLLLKAAEKEGATVSFENRNGPFAGVGIFRTSPGHIWSSSSDYTHAILSFPKCPLLEVHVGIYVSGKSKLYHEADIVVVTRAIARTCRAEQTDPPTSEAILLIECKFYSANPGVALGREFLGLSAECGQRGDYLCNKPAGQSIAEVIPTTQAGVGPPCSAIAPK